MDKSNEQCAIEFLQSLFKSYSNRNRDDINIKEKIKKVLEKEVEIITNKINQLVLCDALKRLILDKEIVELALDKFDEEYEKYFSDKDQSSNINEQCDEIDSKESKDKYVDAIIMYKGEIGKTYPPRKIEGEER